MHDLRSEETPHGLVVADEKLAELETARKRANSLSEWEERSSRFLMLESPIQVLWHEGWIDTGEGLPAAEDLLDAFQKHAKIMSRQQRRESGVTVTIDGWARTPTFDPAKALVTWSLLVRYMPGGAMLDAHRCHLGANGTLRLLYSGIPLGEGEVTDHLQLVSDAVSWTAGSAHTSTQPAQVGEMVGGIRRVMLPRLIFGNPENDRLVFRERGLGWTWLLIVMPVGVALLVFLRWAWSLVRKPPVAVAGAAVAPVTSRCPACGSPVTNAMSRCIACGSSLVRPGR